MILPGDLIVTTHTVQGKLEGMLLVVLSVEHEKLMFHKVCTAINEKYEIVSFRIRKDSHDDFCNEFFTYEEYMNLFGTKTTDTVANREC